MTRDKMKKIMDLVDMILGSAPLLALGMKVQGQMCENYREIERLLKEEVKEDPDV